MRSFAYGALAVAALMTSPAIAKDKKPVDPNKKVCRQEQVTGSLMGGKSICHTVAEWNEIDRQNSQNVQGMHDQMRTTGGTGPGI